MNEYHITQTAHDSRRVYIVYHCPFCGGTAPLSKRDTFFTEVTKEELERLRSLLSAFKTVEEVIANLGEPDEIHGGLMTTPLNGRAAEAQNNRTLKYTNLSRTADVVVVDRGAGLGLGMRVYGKYMGGPKP